jgi:hypothetical protein
VAGRDRARGAIAEAGVPVPEVIAYYLERNMARFLRPDAGIEEVENARRTYMPGGRTARQGEVFRNPDLARTYRPSPAKAAAPSTKAPWPRPWSATSAASAAG